MKKFFIWLGTMIATVGLGILVFWPVANWRLYDENWNPLALTQAENWCSGVQLAENEFNEKRNDPTVDACVLASDLDNEHPSIANSQAWYCQGIVSIETEWNVPECVDTMTGWEIWGLLHGGYTFDWNDARPYPNVAYDNIKQAPARDERNEGGRF